MHAIKKPSVLSMQQAPPRLHWVEPRLWRENTGVQKRNENRMDKMEMLRLYQATESFQLWLRLLVIS